MPQIRRTTEQLIADYELVIRSMKMELKKTKLLTKDSNGMEQLFDHITKVAITNNIKFSMVIRSIVHIKQIKLHEPKTVNKYSKDRESIHTKEWKKKNPDLVDKSSVKSYLGKGASPELIKTLVLIRASKRQLKAA